MWQEGDLVAPGDVIGTVEENSLMSEHKIMIPPGVTGRITKIFVGVGGRTESLTIREPVMEVHNDLSGETHTIRLAHEWPVRIPRPVREKLPGNSALITGQRVIDGMFPSVLGGTCAVPGTVQCYEIFFFGGEGPEWGGIGEGGICIYLSIID